MEQNSKKIYYSMGEVSEMMDVKPSLLRFWEKRFDIIKPHKNKKGNRMFTPADVENLKLIYHMVREKGMTLAGVEQALKKDRGAATRNVELVDRLMTVRSLLDEIRQELYEDDPAAKTIVIENEVVQQTPVMPTREPVMQPQPTPEAEALPEPAAPVATLSVPQPEMHPEPAARVMPSSAPQPEPTSQPDTQPEPLRESIPRIVEQTLF